VSHVLDIPTGLLVEHLQAAAAPETSQAEHDARLVAQVQNATIAMCCRELRHTADDFERLLPAATLPTIMAAAYRSAADHLETLRS
jgi:hypothetical protein